MVGLTCVLQAREYTRALNAVKLERMFAAPFIGQMGHGHRDGVYTLVKNPRSLTTFASGSADGSLKVWDASSREQTWAADIAHDSNILGLCYSANGDLLSAARDKAVRRWRPESSSAPLSTITLPVAPSSISSHRTDDTFAVATNVISIFDVTRTQAIHQLEWGAESIKVVRFNQTEKSVLAAAGSDRTLIFYDLRTASPVAKVVTSLRSNAIAWNPMEAFNLVTGSEDHNMYMFDMRRLSAALTVYKDHVGAVLDVDFSPTGEELVSGSYDRTIRLWRRSDGRSRDVYHTSRMQRAFCVQFSMDSGYVVSGSDDGNVRLWRANASARAGTKTAQQQQQLDYAETVKARFQHMPEIRRIARSRRLPVKIKMDRQRKRVEEERVKRSEELRMLPNEHGEYPKPRTDRDRVIVATVE